MSRVRIKPAPGIALRDHNEGFELLPAEGKDVVLDLVWRKRIKDGDAVLPEVSAKTAEPEVMPEVVEVSIAAAKKKESK